MILKMVNMEKMVIIILFVFATIYVLANLYYGTTRSLIVYVGMFLTPISYHLFFNIFKCHNMVYNKMYISLSIIIIIKFVVDFLFIYLNNCVNCDDIEFLLYLKDLNYKYHDFITPSISIYSFYDYFPFIYYLVVILSIHNLIHKKFFKMSLLLIVIANISILDTRSRLFIYSSKERLYAYSPQKNGITRISSLS